LLSKEGLISFYKWHYEQTILQTPPTKEQFAKKLGEFSSVCRNSNALQNINQKTATKYMILAKGNSKLCMKRNEHRVKAMRDIKIQYRWQHCYMPCLVVRNQE
jgi:hypothetical protein